MRGFSRALAAAAATGALFEPARPGDDGADELGVPELAGEPAPGECASAVIDAPAFAPAVPARRGASGEVTFAFGCTDDGPAAETRDSGGDAGPPAPDERASGDDGATLDILGCSAATPQCCDST